MRQLQLALLMSTSAAIADSRLRRAFGGQARRSLPTYYSSTPWDLTVPHAYLATRLRDFATNRHEYCGLVRHDV